MLLRPDNNSKISNLRTFAPSLTADIKFETIENTIRTCEENYIIPVIGQTLYDHLDDNYATLTGKDKEALRRVQSALANFVAYDYATQNIALIGSRGHQEESSDNSSPARQWVSREHHITLLTTAHNHLEILLNYLNVNKADFTGWASEMLLTLKKSLINSYKEFSDAIELNVPILTYIQLKKYIKESELYVVEPILGNTLYNFYLDGIKNDSLSPQAKIALESIQKIVALSTIKRALPFLNCRLENGLEVLLVSDGISQRIKAEDKIKDSFLAQLESFISNAKARLLNYIKANPSFFNGYVEAEDQKIFLASSDGSVISI